METKEIWGKIVGLCKDLWLTIDLWKRRELRVSMENYGTVHGNVGDTRAYETIQGICGEMELCDSAGKCVIKEFIGDNGNS